MKKVVLANGLRVIMEPKAGNSVVVEALINAGSNEESGKERGITHLLEHMLFEGTIKKPSNQEISNEIEKIGGEFNAYTTNKRTCIYIKVLKKHFAKAVEVLADMLLHPLFKEEHLRKEKKVVIKEIDLMNDEPKYYQWILLQKNLFEKHPAKNPTYGTKDNLKRLSRQDLINYFQKYYVPNNMIVAIVGKVPHCQKVLEQKLTLLPGKKPSLVRIKEPPASRIKVIKEKRDVVNTYLVMGFKTVPQGHPDSYGLEVINAILGRGQSGRMFAELRGKRGLAYEVGTQHIAEVDFGLFAIYATIDNKNTEKVKSLILEELNQLKHVSPKDLQEAKDYIEGNYYLGMDDTQKIADQLLFWEQLKDVHLMKEYIPKIKKVTSADLKRIVEKYFHHFTLVILEGH